MRSARCCQHPPGLPLAIWRPRYNMSPASGCSALEHGPPQLHNPGGQEQLGGTGLPRVWGGQCAPAGAPAQGPRRAAAPLAPAPTWALQRAARIPVRTDTYPQRMRPAPHAPPATTPAACGDMCSARESVMQMGRHPRPGQRQSTAQCVFMVRHQNGQGGSRGNVTSHRHTCPGRHVSAHHACASAPCRRCARAAASPCRVTC